MKKQGLITAAAAVLAVVLMLLQNVMSPQKGIDSILGMAMSPSGHTLVAMDTGEDLTFCLINQQGRILRQLALPRELNGETYSVKQMELDDQQRLFLLLDIADGLSGEFLRQEVAIYDLRKIFFKRVQKFAVEMTDNMRYRFMEVSTTVVLMALDSNERYMIREAFDYKALLLGQLVVLNTRNYDLNEAEGVYHAVAVGQSVAYMTRSGKVFVAEDGGTAQEIYPARELTSLMYPMYIAGKDTGSVYIGEQPSGDVLSLAMSDGATSVVKAGTEPFAGASDYTPVDVVKIDMKDPLNFVAVVRNKTSGYFDVIVSLNGMGSTISLIRAGRFTSFFSLVGRFLWITAAIWLGVMAIVSFFRTLRLGRTILTKLVTATVPLLVLVLALFGVFAYDTYKESIEDSFRKQMVDEGNMLSAVFGADAFHRIEFPYDYTVEEYTYLWNQMSTRQTYIRTAYYERGALYVGVDFDEPCFYPFDIRMNAAAADLYLQAAFTGEAQTGVIRDSRGERLVAVTPMGGISGNTVYLLETGVLTANLDQYTRTYLWTYALVAFLFLFGLGLLMTLLFMKILRPIGVIKAGLEAFSQGDRKVRLESTSSDELADIVRVFNKMANDIDAQIFSLRQASEMYYRFIPQRIFTMLGKNNLGDVELGSRVEVECQVLMASLWPRQGALTLEQEQELTNRFFNVVNMAANSWDGVLITDRINLRRLRIICPAGGDSAVHMALKALVGVGAINAALPVQSSLDVQFVVHKTLVFYGICGDEQRLVPALLSRDLDLLTEYEQYIHGFSSKLLVTQAALSDISVHDFFHRFIGYADQQKRIGLFDFYDAASVEETRLINDTKNTFDKAMSLYLSGRYYEAKNLFALVLRQNRYDNVSRRYIFDCEEKLQTQS